MPTREDVLDRCRSDDIDLIRMLHVDDSGITRARTADADDAETMLDEGANMAKVVQTFSPFNLPSATAPYGAVGEARLIPDPDTFRELPYAENTAAMICDKYTVEGDRWDADPRTVLRDYLADAPYDPVAAFESEWYLTREDDDGGLVPADETSCFTADGAQAAHGVVSDIVQSLKAQGMDLARYYAEYGPGQQELVVKHSRGIQAADEQVLYKQTVKAVAAEHGYRATFAPKPFKELPGSGCHIHLSLWDGEENVFHETGADGPYDISETGRQFIAGILEHAPALIALTAPTVISYKRLQPGMWASAYNCWGEDNREAMVRVPSAQWDSPAGSRRIELKAADNTANPYLVVLGILAAGMDGIERGLDPGEPLQANPANLSADDLADRGIERYPETLSEAVDALEENDVLADAMGETLHSTYIDTKRFEVNQSRSTVTDWDIDTYTREF